MPTLLHHAIAAADGTPFPASALQGHVLLVVNIATQCPYASQMPELERLQRRHAGRNFSVLAFPSNDFGDLEPTADALLPGLCARRWQVTFPVLAKVRVCGPAAHPLWAELARQAGEPGWNFHKYLIGMDSKVIRAFGPDVLPLDPSLTEAVAEALAEVRTLRPAVRR
jgi:glutathione peroxidase